MLQDEKLSLLYSLYNRVPYPVIYSKVLWFSIMIPQLPCLIIILISVLINLIVFPDTAYIFQLLQVPGCGFRAGILR